MPPTLHRTGFRRTGWLNTARHSVTVVLALVAAVGAAAQSSIPSHPIDDSRPPSNGSTAAVAQLPVNLVVPSRMVPLVWSMWLQSPTFRRQCQRLSQHPEIVVEFELTARVARNSGRARLKRRPGGMTAAVQIGLREPSGYVELIAHELEHVLEQLDGTDLATFERLGVDGVVRANHEHYDTLRARSIGRAVARESRR
jgi:hypothetical protein